MHVCYIINALKYSLQNYLTPAPTAGMLRHLLKPALILTSQNPNNLNYNINIINPGCLFHQASSNNTYGPVTKRISIARE